MARMRDILSRRVSFLFYVHIFLFLCLLFEQWMNTFEWIFKYIAFKLKCIAKVKLKILMSQFCRWNNFPIISVYVCTQCVPHTHTRTHVCVWVSIYRIIYCIGQRGDKATKYREKLYSSLGYVYFCYIHSLRFRQSVLLVVGCWQQSFFRLHT